MNTKMLLGLLLATSTAVACSAQTDEEDGAAPEAQEGAWEAQSVTNEASSTHLWVVNRGVDILGRHPELPAAKLASEFMNNAQCRKNWQQGLFDADFKAEYNNGRRDLPLNPSDAQVGLAGSTWESHFYDVDTGLNYKGNASPTALTEADAHLARAFENGAERLANHDARACYELGLALHYYTDLTQPMHAVNFTAVDRPAKLHSNIEGYSMEVQDRYPLADWTGPASGELHDFIKQTARDSKGLWEPGVQAIVNAYNRRQWTHGALCRDIDAAAWRFLGRQHVDYRRCWEGDADVDKMIGRTLKQAQDHTAQFVYLVALKVQAAMPVADDGEPGAGAPQADAP